MSKLKDWLLGGGIVLVAIGLSCLPIGFGANPKRDTSFFFNVADTGAFLKPALILVVIGSVIILVSLIIFFFTPPKVKE